MAIESVAIIGRGAVGMLYGSIAERNLGPGAVEFVMDDERFARHAPSTRRLAPPTSRPKPTTIARRLRSTTILSGRGYHI